MKDWQQSENAAPALANAGAFLIVGNALLERVVDQADKVARLMTNVTREAFLDNPLLVDAVSMPPIRIATTLEAVLHVHPDVVADDLRINSAIDLGRDLIHFYRQIDLLRLYEAASVEAPALRSKLVQALAANKMA
ncbi:MAG: hypothetical protein ACKVS5_15870 [Parvularculaceae bacterium]